MSDTYPMPEDGWVCFHCGERFYKIGSAQDHFGARPWAKVACAVTTVELRAELMEYRKLELRFGPLTAGTRKTYNRYVSQQGEG